MEHYPFVNWPLRYDYAALEPYIDAQTMHLHHDRHLQTYIDNLNTALKSCQRLQTLSLEQIIMTASTLPSKTGIPIARNAGGVYNHRFYFDGLTPDAPPRAIGRLAAAINQSFGSFETFQTAFSKEALSVFGSGYAWLTLNRRRQLSIIITSNQDTPLTMGLYPIINIDVWEHAYYLKHYNKRADYIEDWWHVINWSEADERYINGIYN